MFLKVSADMKQFLFFGLSVLMFLFFPRKSNAQRCEDSSVNLGKIDSTWLYINPSIKISYRLPMGWYLFDQLGPEKKYIRIGSDFLKLSAPLADNGPGPIVGLDQIKSHPLDYSMSLFSLAKLDDT